MSAPLFDCQASPQIRLHQETSRLLTTLTPFDDAGARRVECGCSSGMPSSRARSCENCRAAKTRCDQSTTCARCINRGLECRYIRAERNTGREAASQNLRPLRPAVSVSADLTGPCGSVSEQAPAKSSANPASALPDGAHDQGHGDDIVDTSSASIGAAATTQDTNIPSFSVSELFDLPESFDLSPFAFDFDMVSANPDSLNQPVLQLKQRSRSFQQGSLTAKLLFSKLAAYGQDMADAARLPPFIYPPCWSSPAAACQPDSPHRCLPESLAVCSNLAQMFYLRRIGSENFVWQQICIHLKQMCEQVKIPPSLGSHSNNLTSLSVP